ncbi:putative aminopeptidase-2 [Aphelenchoides fujianensis]|nr:putative aminopeptidase-2 [Aphelenchoides fujianensis]
MYHEAEDIAGKCVDEIQKLLDIQLENDATKLAIFSYFSLAEGRMNLQASMDAMNTRFEQTPLRICREVAYQWFGEALAERHNSTGYDFVRGGLTSYFQYRALRPVIDDDEYLKSEMVGAHEQAFADPNLPLIPLAEQSDLEAPTLEIGSLHAASVFCMIKKVMGEERFYSAISKFLLASEHSEDMTEDLIKAFEKEMDGQMLCGKLSIRDFVHDYFYERGYPVVHVDADEKKRTFVFAQSPSAPAETRWNVPMFVWSNRTNEKPAIVWLLKEGGLCIPDGRAGLQLDDAAYIFNYDAFAFARFVYSDAVLQRLLDMPKSSMIDEATQLDLLHGEKWLISFNYQLELYKLLRKLSRVFAEKSAGRAEFPGMRVSPQRSRQLLQKFAADSERGLSPQIADLAREWLHEHEMADSKCAWDAQDYRCGHFNKRHLQAAVMSNRSEAREQGRRMFDEFAKACADSKNFFECNKIPIDSRPAVYCAGVIDEEPEPMAFLERYRAFHREILDIYGLMHDENSYITEGFIC